MAPQGKVQIDGRSYFLLYHLILVLETLTNSRILELMIFSIYFVSLRLCCAFLTEETAVCY